MDLTQLISSGKVYTSRLKDELHLIDTQSGETVSVYGIRGTEYIPYEKVTDPATNKAIWCNPKSELSTQALIPDGRVPYSDFLVMEILDRVTSGEGLTTICLDSRMPTYPQFARWMKINPWIKPKLEEARLARAEYHRDKVKEEAEMAKSYKDPIEATRLKIDAHKWLAGTDDPRYTNRAKVDVAVAATQTFIIQTGIERGEEREVASVQSEAVGVEARVEETTGNNNDTASPET